MHLAMRTRLINYLCLRGVGGAEGGKWKASAKCSFSWAFKGCSATTTTFSTTNKLQMLEAPKGHRPMFCMWLSREEVTLNSGCDHDNVLGVLHALQNTVQLLELSVIQQRKRHTLYRQIFLPMSTVAAWLGVVCRLAFRFLWGCPGRCI